MGSDPVAPDLTSLCRAIAEHAPVPMAALAGPNHIVRYANAAFCQLFDQAAEQLCGKPFADIVPRDDECLMLLERVQRSGQAESHTGQTASQAQPTFWSYTVWPVLLGERPVAVMLQVAESAQFHDQTVAMNQALVLGALRQHELTEAADSLNARLHNEITGRKQAQLAMRESEARYRNLFEAMDEGYCIIDVIFDEHEKPVDWRFIEVNPAFAKLTGLHDAVGKRMRELAPEHEAHWFETYGRVALSGEPIRFVNEAQSLDKRWFDLYAFKVGGPASRSVAVLFTNITEKRQSEQQLLEQAQALVDLDRRKDEFLAMLSHELRNPLAAMSNAVQLLRLQKNEGVVQKQARAIIERQVGQLKHLVDDLLEISRISTGRVQLRRDLLDLRDIALRAVETTQPLITQKGHELQVALPPEPVWLQADAARLEQVLVNLLNNAAKYTDAGGRIALSVELEDAAAVIKVRDSGIGIEPALLPYVFELFTQAQRSLDRAQGGLGIGLSLVQRLVLLHGGSVEAHSVLGQGSEFVVRLPIKATTLPVLPASPAPNLDTAQPPKKTSSGCRVLVVDDNVDAAQSLAQLLELTGHEARLAYDGTSGLQAALDYRPEVVLLDIGLPGLDGYQVAERIRQQDALKNIVLVALTGYGQDTDRQRSQEAGFDHHLVKPSDFDDIENILAGVASLRKA